MQKCLFPIPILTITTPNVPSSRAKIKERYANTPAALPPNNRPLRHHRPPRLKLALILQFRRIVLPHPSLSHTPFYLHFTITLFILLNAVFYSQHRLLQHPFGLPMGNMHAVAQSVGSAHHVGLLRTALPYFPRCERGDECAE
jgi:hypothetical protein